MKKFMNLSLILTVALSASSLVGCAFGNNTDEQTKQEIEDREKLMQNFSRVVGSYSGSLIVDGKSIELEASISTVDEQSGTNSNGEPRFLPVLKLRYRQKDTVRPDLILNARYIAENGSLNASSGSTSLRGIFQGETITGTVFKSEGRLGAFELTRNTVTPDSPIEDPATDYQNRLREKYNTIVGVYNGTMKSHLNNKEPETIRVVLTQYDEHTNGTTNVILRAILIDPETNIQLAPPMNASYLLEYTPAKLRMGALGWSATGDLENGVYKAVVTSNTGLVADLVVVKQKK